MPIFIVNRHGIPIFLRVIPQMGRGLPQRGEFLAFSHAFPPNGKNLVSLRGEDVEFRRHLLIKRRRSANDANKLNLYF